MQLPFMRSDPLGLPLCMRSVDYSLLPVGAMAGRTLPGGRTYTQAVGANQTEETVQTSASTVARWAFVANLPRIGLLADGGIGLVLEPPRTNRALRSDALETASWFVESVAVTVGANATASPTGTVDAESVSWTAAALRYIGQTGTFALEASTLSVWAKASSGKIRLRLPSQVGVSNVDSADITPTAAWAAWQHTVTNATTAGTSTALIESDVALAAMSGHMWGAQLEAGKYRTNLIPTGATAAARGGFRLTLPVNTYVIGGSFRAQISHVPWADCTAYSGDSATVRLWTIDANTYAEINTTTRVLTVCVNGVSRVAAVPIWWLSGHRIEWYWRVGNGALFVRYRLSTDKGVSYTLPFDPFAGVQYTDAAISTSATSLDLWSDGGSSKWFGTGACKEDFLYTAPAWALQALPTDVASVKAFFRADSSYTLAGSLVSAWAGQTATAVTPFTQGTTANQPAINAAAFGSARPGITTDGTNDYMTGANITSVWTAAAKTIYALVRVNAVSLDNATIYTNHGIVQDSGSYSGLVARANTPRFGSWNYDGAYKVAYSAGGSVSVGTSCVVRVRHSSGTVGIRVGNGVEVTAAAGASAWGAGPYLLRMGTQYNAAAGFTAADFGAMVFGNAEPSAGEDATIMDFLNRYGGLA